MRDHCKFVNFITEALLDKILKINSISVRYERITKVECKITILYVVIWTYLGILLKFECLE